MNFLQVPPEPIAEEQWRLTYERMQEWLRQELFTFRWWILLALFIITMLLWLKMVDKTRLNKIILYTVFVIIYIIVLDELGEELCLWYYPVDLFFLFPPTTAIDYSCLPLIYMVIYQKFSNWKSFAIANIVMATVFCFIFEPIFVAAGLYKTIAWRSYYGFPIYIFIAFSSKFIVDLIYSRSARLKKEA